ncbi:biliverdin-producing heme oxygenase [Leeia sp. TBRC 13508]|uniref:Biliverdin-producing heme oxygenase n=1 Tax=Leeia speluncae TaxID=2884804 RepID=A0ABS8D8S0_9NEIS|nr:biliverdin-producing heme oxygenase [Leeia speluncae]MCB6184564.1 biliverdin-producing heme oxygenase [Leeia speluncae]
MKMPAGIFPDMAKQLKSATTDFHRALDHHEMLRGLLSTPISEVNYTIALTALFGPTEALEIALSDYLPLEKFSPRAALIAKDLQDLKAQLLPCSIPLPTFESESAIVGGLYVLEGSHLGGSVIAKHLHHHSTISLPCRFFSESEGYTRWQRFWNYLTPRLPHLNQEDATEAAKATFSFFIAHFDECAKLNRTRKAQLNSHLGL